MANDTDYKPVVFENSLGEEISNDPFWHAQKVLAEYAQTREPQYKPETDADELLEHDDEYAGKNGKELKALAEEQELDITGLTKVGEVRQAFRDRDARLAAEAEVAAANAGN